MFKPTTLLILGNAKRHAIKADESGITVRCPVCKKEFKTPPLTEAALKTWLNGAMIQDVWPEWTLDQRELLISGIDQVCWDRMFK